ncbi:hypothetical protein [Nocardioides sp.]|uniref:hypothetical protein n=1 Tax=Nocardioides sp. TaxID=35761 RepID=UPI002ED6035D
MPASERHGLPFWVRRYLPAELAGSATLLGGGLAASTATSSPAAIAYAAALGEIVGFYLVLGAMVYREQRAQPGGRQVARILGRTLVLLTAEFGAAELLDTLLVRPAAMTLGIWLLGSPVWGLVVGKIAADLVFYVVAAGAFTVTARTGMRTTSPKSEPTSNPTLAA